MANVDATQQLAKYTDDFGKEYENFKVKFEKGIIDRTGLEGEYENRKASASCGTSTYFKPRRLKLVLTDGKSIELVVPSIGEVNDFAKKVLAKEDVACASLIGERWGVIPKGILGGDYADKGLDGVNKPPSRKVTFKYFLDGGGEIIKSMTVDDKPDELADAQVSCVDKITDATIACSIGGGIDPRHFIGIRLNTETDGKFGRKIPVSSADPQEIKKCGSDVMNKFNCLGYQGTSIANIGDFYSK